MQSKVQLTLTTQEILEYDFKQAKMIQNQVFEIMNDMLDNYDSDLGQIHHKKEVLLALGQGNVESIRALDIEVKPIILFHR